LFLLIFLFAGQLFFYVYVPRYMESAFLPQFFRKVGVDDFECDVRRIDFTGADIGGLRVGAGERPSVSAESVRLDYAPLALLRRRHIDRVMVDGLSLSVEIVNKKVFIHNLDWRRIMAAFFDSKEKVSRGPGADFEPSVSVGRLVINNAVLLCDYKGKHYRLPFDLSASPATINGPDGRRDVWDCLLKFYPRGQTVRLSSRINPVAGAAALHFYADSLQPAVFADFADFLDGPLFAPAALRFDAHGDLHFKQGGVVGSGDFTVTPVGFDDLRPTASFVAPFAAAGKFSAAYTENGIWNFDLAALLQPEESAPAGQGRLFKYKDFSITAKAPALHIAGHGEKGKGTVNVSLQIAGLAGTGKSVDVRMPSLVLNGACKIGEAATTGVSADFKISAADTEILADSLLVKGGFFFTGKIKRPVVFTADGRAWRVEGQAKFANGEIAAPELETKAHGINVIIPWQWLGEGSGKEGEFSVAAVTRGASRLGSISGTARQDGDALFVAAQYKSALLPGLTMDIDSRTSLSPRLDFQSHSIFHVAGFNAESIDLGVFFPAAKGVILAGDIGLDGDLFVNACDFKSSVTAKLQNVAVTMQDKGVAIQGVAVSLTVPDLLKMRSLPAQRLTFKKASLGELNVSNGEIVFQLESPAALFIENSRVSWCKGHVYTQAVRLLPGADEYDIVLYADDLELAEVFEQLGVGGISGQGAVNGRIPFNVKKGRLNFGSGFLYSTPGVGGKIRMAGVESLAAAVPRDAPQYSQLDFANEALKNFDYNWVKLLLSPDGENLVLKMALDGKPAGPLPFTYNRRLGVFTRIAGGGKKGIDYPLRLDVNFRLPLNEVLHYGGSIKDVFKKAE